MAAKLPQVVIVGRPNVGKSSIFNWLAGRRISIVDPTLGVTRDRISTIVEFGDRHVELVDTGGMGIADLDQLGQLVERQIDRAIEDADVLLFVTDAQEGITPLDELVARKLRYTQKPVVLAANKCDTPSHDVLAAEFYKLGRGRLVCVSVCHNRGKQELIEALVERLPEQVEEGNEPDRELKLAVVGRRNAGKSTFVNTLARAERVIVSEIPGTTRDAIDVRVELDGHRYLVIDTAGVMRRRSIATSVDFYSVARAQKSIRRADVVLLFFDPTEGVTRVEKQLAARIAEEFKPCVFVVNKWDLMKHMPAYRVADRIRAQLGTMSYVPIVFISALTGKNMKALLDVARQLHDQAGKRMNTGQVNRVLEELLEAHTPPIRQNRRPKIYYATQVAVHPPTLVLFCNDPNLFDATYQRYLLRGFRERSPYPEVPIRMFLRRRTEGAKRGTGHLERSTAEVESKASHGG